MSDHLYKDRETSCQVAMGDERLSPDNSQFGTRRLMYDVLVLDARLRQSLMVVRSLGSRGLRVAALGIHGGEPTFSSRWCQRAFIYLTDEGAESYITYLEQLLDRISVRVLISSSDDTIALIRRHREQLDRRVRIALAKEPSLGIAINKERTLEVAKRLGLGVPRAVSVRMVSEVPAALSEIGLPAVVKPVESWSWSKQQGRGEWFAPKLVSTPDEARYAVEELTGFGGTTLVQQYLPGRREAINFLYANGQMHARFAQWAKRTYPPLGGVSVLRQSIAVPEDIGEQAERLVREIDLEGYSEVEFRRDSAGIPYLMEINPRLSASVEVAVRAGIDFPSLLYQWADGERIDVVKGYHVGIWTRYLGGDFRTTVAAVLERGRPGVNPPVQAILAFCASFFVPMSYDYVDWKDPLPAWAAIKGFILHALRLVGNRLSRRGFRISANRSV